MNFHESPSPKFDTYVCNVKDGLFTLDEANNKLTILSTGPTLDTCNNLGNPDFEALYFGFFQGSTVYDYSVSPPNLDIPAYLTIIAPNGDTIVYVSNTLSKNNRLEIILSIYPNPVKDKLFISSSRNSKNHAIEIYDILGNLKISERLKTESVNVESLSKGFYFLLIKDDLGNSATKKFVK